MLPSLFGVPVGIKDVTATKGIRTTHGSKLFEAHVPDEDALVVERLRAAGATRNPWNLALTAGGSSGGSAAALATGMCQLGARVNRPYGEGPAWIELSIDA